MKAKRVMAALVFGPIGAGSISDAFALVRKSFKEKPSYLDIEEAEAIAARWPAYEAVEIKQGTFGGAPPEPAEAINTFAVSVRLVARASLPDRVAGEITRLLLSTKAKLASTLPVVGEMEAPATEKTSVLPAHPGTLAYLNGEQVALLDETLISALILCRFPARGLDRIPARTAAGCGGAFASASAHRTGATRKDRLRYRARRR